MMNYFKLKLCLAFITVTFYASSQSTLSKNSPIKEIFSFVNSYNKSFNIGKFNFDTIKSVVLTDINLFNLKGIDVKNNTSSYLYKIRKITHNQSLVYFKYDSLIGAINKIEIDSTLWVGKVFCNSKKSNQPILSSENNILIGFKEGVLLLTNNTAINGERISIQSVEDIYRVLILDNNLKFKELLFLNANFKEPTTSVMLNYNSSFKSDFVNIFVVNKDFIGSLSDKSLSGVAKMYKDYIDSYLYTYQYPVSSFKVIGYEKNKHKLDRRRVWLYDENFYLFPYKIKTCCD